MPEPGEFGEGGEGGGAAALDPRGEGLYESRATSRCLVFLAERALNSIG